MHVTRLFEEELRRRGIHFSMDIESGRHIIQVGEWRTLVSLDNLKRGVASDGDAGRIARFVDTIMIPPDQGIETLSADELYWSIEPNSDERADYRVEISDRVDRVLVHLSSDMSRIEWVTSAMLHSLGLTQSEAEEKAFANLARALTEATVECLDIEGVQLGYITSKLPFKAALILAPNLRDMVESKIGWPLMAVIPDREFLYFWAARHSNFAQRVGGVVVDEYSKAPYPLSTEVFEITNETVRAIGEFPCRP